MTEQELEMLMRAGRAAGLEVGVIHQRPHRRCAEGWTPWNAWDDNSDAFQLAVTLRIRCEPIDGYGVAYAGGQCAEMFTERHSSRHAGDACAPQRHAIVRAAAAMEVKTPNTEVVRREASERTQS